ncbi:MAG: stage II sporulation protein M [Bacillota bacterium]
MRHIRATSVGWTVNFRENIGIYIFILMVFIIGIVLGAMAMKSLDYGQKAELFSYVSLFVRGLVEGTGVKSPGFGQVALSHVKTSALLWVLGLSVVGMPVVAAVIFMRGFILGFTVGFLAMEMGWRGMLFAAVSVFPQNILAVPVALAAATWSVSFSWFLVRRRRSPDPLLPEIFRYTVLCAMAAAVLLVAGMVETYISPALMKLVSGYIS